MKILNYKKLMDHKPTEVYCTANSKGQHIRFFEHPTAGEEHSILGVIGKVAFDTGFYDVSEFGMFSEYNPVLLDDRTVVCEFDCDKSQIG